MGVRRLYCRVVHEELTLPLVISNIYAKNVRKMTENKTEIA
jgi:hypothetical protein